MHTVTPPPDVAAHEFDRHTFRTRELARAIAVALGLDPNLAFLAAGFHEGTPDAPSERQTTNGLDRLAFRAISLGMGPTVADALRFQCERPDGQGPFGLRTRQIPPLAAIVGVSHWFDVLVDGERERVGAALEFLDGHYRFDSNVVAGLSRVVSGSPC